MMIWLVPALLIALTASALLYRQRVAQRSVQGKSNTASEIASAVSAPANESEPHVLFRTNGTADVAAAVYALAFGARRIDYQILGEHREVLTETKDAVLHAVHQQEFFPRRPALLPKLLRALNAADSSRDEIVRLILQDPVLAGNVLKRANSAYYRQGAAATESVDRAVVILGNEGLRAPVATAVMQPVFRLPHGFFDRFAPLTWELAQRSAIAAECCARAQRTGDPFAAHLLGLLGGLGRIVLFRMTLDKYRAHNILPRAEVFIRVMMDHELHLTRAVAQAWELSDTFVAAIDAQLAQISPQEMSPLARILYHAQLCGELALLCGNDKYAPEAAVELLSLQGMEPHLVKSVWTVATNAELD